MKRLFLCAALALSLSACGATHVSDASTAYTVSAYTVGGADATYIAAEKVGEVAVGNGVLDKALFKELDSKAYATLLALRAARAAGVQADVNSASTAFQAAIDALNAYKGK